MKLGRNEPCHCGSGKKYKRCCLSKDEQEKSKSSPALKSLYDVDDYEDDDEYLDDDPDDFHDPDDEDGCAEEDESVSMIPFREYAERYTCKNFEEDIPEASVADQKIVDEWWTEFEKVFSKRGDSPMESLTMIRKFLLEHPTLAPNLCLHEEVLFALETAFNRQDDYGTFVEFLIWFRVNHFGAYRLSGTYFDNSLISYLVIHNRLDEIPQYFSIYREYPDHTPDNLLEIIELFQMTDNGDLLITLLKDIYPQIYYSHNVIGGHIFVHPIVVDICSRYFKPSYNEQDLDAMLAELQTLAENVPHLGLQIKNEHWKKVLDETFNRRFPPDYPTQRTHVFEYYRKICHHFSGYLSLHQNKTQHFAEYYVSLIQDYLDAQLKNSRTPKNTLGFSNSTLDKYMGKRFKSFIYLKELSCLSFLDAMWCFAEYLQEENIISLETAKSNVEICRNLYRSIYKPFSEQRYSARLFENLEERHQKDLERQSV